MKAHSREKLFEYLTRVHPVDSAPQAESGTPRPTISGSVGYVRFGGSATGSVGPAFKSEEERRGYMRRVLEEAQRAIRDAELALDAPITAAAPSVADDVDEVAELGDRLSTPPTSRRSASQQTRPAR